MRIYTKRCKNELYFKIFQVNCHWYISISKFTYENIQSDFLKKKNSLSFLRLIAQGFLSLKVCSQSIYQLLIILTYFNHFQYLLLFICGCTGILLKQYSLKSFINIWSFCFFLILICIFLNLHALRCNYKLINTWTILILIVKFIKAEWIFKRAVFN